MFEVSLKLVAVAVVCHLTARQEGNESNTEYTQIHMFSNKPCSYTEFNINSSGAQYKDHLLNN